MSLTRRHFAALLMAATLACVESPMEPGQSHVLPAITPRLMLPPGTTPASFGLAIDTIEIMIAEIDTTCVECVAGLAAGPRSHLVLGQAVDTIFTDTLMAWPATQESFSFRFEVPPPEPGFAIRVYLYYYAGPQNLFSGYADVDFRPGNIRLPEIPLYYYGPGYLADDIALFPGDTAMAPGDTLQFSATAFINGLISDTAYISWRVSDSTKAKIDHFGRLTLRPGALGSTFFVSAAVPNFAMATARVSVPNTVATLVAVSGDTQSVALGIRAAKPLTVKAVDGNGKPVAGARISFFPTVAATVAMPDSVIFTDAQGLARSGPVPIVLGASTVRAQLTGTTKQVDFTVTGTAPGAARAFLFVADSGIGGQQLYRADSLGGGRITIGYLPGSAIEYAWPRWNVAHDRVAYTAYNGNSGNYDLRLTTAIGDTTATLVSDAYGSGARFSPTGKMIAFDCGNLASDFSGYVCTVNAVDGDLSALNGAGNGAGRVEVTAVVPGRPNGPVGFAWRPDASTHIAFVRDTASTDSLSGWQSSRFYQTNGDGTTLTALSPKVMDLGTGPLQVKGWFDWSPDGSYIAFSATDTSYTYGYTSSLFLLNVTTGAVQRLTTPPSGWQGDLHPRFSPDGQWILFHRVYYEGGSMQMDYYITRTDGGGMRRITWAGSGWASGASIYHGGDWAPDGRSVVVSAPNGLGQEAAYIVPLDTQDQTDYLTRRRLVGTAGIAGLRDLNVSWGP